METIALIILAYLVTGLSLSAYDFSAHPIDRKQYVQNKNFLLVAFVICAWPLYTILEVYIRLRYGKSGARYLYGVVLLAAGTFFWGRLFYVLTHLVVPNSMVSLVITVVTMLLVSPYLVRFSLPAHRPNPQFKLPW
jgi:hypothetical protein